MPAFLKNVESPLEKCKEGTRASPIGCTKIACFLLLTKDFLQMAPCTMGVLVYVLCSTALIWGIISWKEIAPQKAFWSRLKMFLRRLMLTLEASFLPPVFRPPMDKPSLLTCLMVRSFLVQCVTLWSRLSSAWLSKE